MKRVRVFPEISQENERCVLGGVENNVLILPWEAFQDSDYHHWERSVIQTKTVLDRQIYKWSVLFSIALYDHSTLWKTKNDDVKGVWSEFPAFLKPVMRCSYEEPSKCCSVVGNWNDRVGTITITVILFLRIWDVQTRERWQVYKFPLSLPCINLYDHAQCVEKH